MSDFTFPTAGPLMDTSPFYVRREADGTAAVHLERMEYVTLAEPRQSGKTSLINQLIARYSGKGYAFAVRDLGPARSRSASPKEWYTSLGHWILERLDFVAPGDRPAAPSDGGSWESFLVEIAKRAEANGVRLAVVLDEVGAFPAELATDFFSVIRSVYSTRQSLPFYQHLTFIIAGAFDPRSLIRDKSVSDFNVDHRIHLADFSVEQISALVSHLGLPPVVGEAAAARLQYWTDGQPYLCQWLCQYLKRHGAALKGMNIEAVVDAGVDTFFQEGNQHLSGIKGLKDQPALLGYIRQLVTEPRARFSASLNDSHFFLAHVAGVIKADSNSLCQIRNRIYERALAEVESSTVVNAAAGTRGVLTASVDDYAYDVFISYSHEDVNWVQGQLVPYLNSHGVRICIDSSNFEVGIPVLENTKNAIRLSRKIILVMTPSWVGSVWASFEALLIQTLHPSGNGRILPLLVERCEVPDHLKIFTHLDFTQPDSFNTQMPRLMAALRNI